MSLGRIYTALNFFNIYCKHSTEHLVENPLSYFFFSGFRKKSDTIVPWQTPNHTPSPKTTIIHLPLDGFLCQACPVTTAVATHDHTLYQGSRETVTFSQQQAMFFRGILPPQLNLWLSLSDHASIGKNTKTGVPPMPRAHCFAKWEHFLSLCQNNRFRCMSRRGCHQAERRGDWWGKPLVSPHPQSALSLHHDNAGNMKMNLITCQKEGSIM
jgi:hypothetical protein